MLVRLMVFLLGIPLLGFAQPRAVRVETLPLGSARSWNQPRWSPDGKTVYYTSTDFNGIWAYSTADKRILEITRDRQSGFGFNISPDGARVAYRRTFAGSLPGERLQEAVVRDIVKGTSSILASGTSITVPNFVQSDVVYSVGNSLQGVTAGSQPAGTVSVLGIEDTKIAVLRNGLKTYLDPLGGGSYIWPSLSPDGSRLVAYEMDRGAFVSGPDGSHPANIGRRDAPSWTRDGKWLIYMEDKDDGHAIRSSVIAYVSPDGKVGGKLTATSRRIELYPQCSPVDDKIVCSTLSGEVLIITYTESPR